MFEIIVIQMFLKIQERQLTGNARIKKVEILSQAWCDSKWEPSPSSSVLSSLLSLWLSLAYLDVGVSFSKLPVEVININTIIITVSVIIDNPHWRCILRLVAHRVGRELEGQDRGFWVFPHVSSKDDQIYRTLAKSNFFAIEIDIVITILIFSSCSSSFKPNHLLQVYCVAFNATYRTKFYRKEGSGGFRSIGVMAIILVIFLNSPL